MYTRNEILFLSGEKEEIKENLEENFTSGRKPKIEPLKKTNKSVLLEKGKDGYRIFVDHKLIGSGKYKINGLLQLLGREGVFDYNYREIK